MESSSAEVPRITSSIGKEAMRGVLQSAWVYLRCIEATPPTIEEASAKLCSYCLIAEKCDGFWFSYVFALVLKKDKGLCLCQPAFHLN